MSEEQFLNIAKDCLIGSLFIVLVFCIGSFYNLNAHALFVLYIFGCYSTSIAMAYDARKIRSKQIGNKIT